MKKSQVVAAALVATAIASPAFAADLLKAPAAAPVAPSWNGWYIGGEVGDKWVKDDWTSPCVQDGKLLACGTRDHNNQFAFPGAPDSAHSFTTSGVRAGVYAGAMFQVNPTWVVGIEGDYAFYDESSSIVGIVGCSTLGCRGITPNIASRFTTALDSTSVKNGDDFSLRLRGGFLVTPDILVYGTGGLAFQRVEGTMACGGVTAGGQASAACFTSGTNRVSSTVGRWLPGWTVGGGVEWKLTQFGLSNWLLRGEYRYADFGDWKPEFFGGAGGIDVLSRVKVTSQIATAGVAYKFSY
jgi:outer membrane immunogenic protein